MAPRRAILLVDDDSELCDVCRHAFAEIGFDTVATSVRSEVARLATTRPFALVFFDLRLPDWGGVEEVRYLKQLIHAPVVVLSGLLPSDGELIEAREAGVTDWITMPYDLDYLCEIVRRYC